MNHRRCWASHLSHMQGQHVAFVGAALVGCPFQLVFQADVKHRAFTQCLPAIWHCTRRCFCCLHHPCSDPQWELSSERPRVCSWLGLAVRGMADYPHVQREDKWEASGDLLSLHATAQGLSAAQHPQHLDCGVCGAFPNTGDREGWGWHSPCGSGWGESSKWQQHRWWGTATQLPTNFPLCQAQWRTQKKSIFVSFHG